MRICPDCHAPVRETADFCDNCGYPLGSGLAGAAALSLPAEKTFVGEATAGTCSSCGYQNIPGEMFCQNCGVQLAPVPSIPPPPPTPISPPKSQPESPPFRPVEEPAPRSVALPKAIQNVSARGEMNHKPDTVHISIGRVEVRALVQSNPRPSRPASKPTMMTLDEYLTRRAKGESS